MVKMPIPLVKASGVFYLAGMKSFFPNRLIAPLAFSTFVALLSWGVWELGYRSALEQLSRRGESDLELAADRLTGELQGFRELAALMSDHPVVASALGGAYVQDTLAEIADKTGALNLSVVDTAGQEIASARGDFHYVGDRTGFERAMDGALGVEHLRSDRFNRRVFVFYAPIFGVRGPVTGAVSVTVDVEAIESSWRGDQQAIYFTDSDRLIFISNRSELVLLSKSENPATPNGIEPFFEYQTQSRYGHEVWLIDGGRYLPSTALHLQLEMPTVDLLGEALLDVAPARQIAGLQAAVAAALCLAFGAMLFWATERRRTLAIANRQLEARVQKRTAELEATAVELRREVVERAAAEARLKKAQDDLVQAGKLSALGQMSAGISHELNQPLMAIRSFAENAEAFLERGKPERAAENLNRISELVRRMGRIIKNLRAFSKQESEPLTDVELGAAIDATLEMAATKARQENAVIQWDGMSGPLWVRAGEVRLQQVLLNLISNAIDAMEGQEEKTVRVAVASGDRVTVAVRDHGPGIAEPEKIFDPFYSTKQVGAAKGMGLGLSISYGLVQSFGGAIRGRNHPDGGAIFTIELDAAKRREDA